MYGMAPPLLCQSYSHLNLQKIERMLCRCWCCGFNFHYNYMLTRDLTHFEITRKLIFKRTHISQKPSIIIQATTVVILLN